MISRVIYKFMTTPNPIYFTPLEVVDNIDASVMMDAFSQHSYMVQLELYIDVAEARSSSKPVSTQPTITQPTSTEDAGSHVVEEALAKPYTARFGSIVIEEPQAVHSDAVVNLADDACAQSNPI